MWWHREISPGIWAAFTSTSAGNLAFHVGDDPRAVAARRAAVTADLGLTPGSLQFMSQVHGNHVAHVAAGDYPLNEGPTADAMVSLDAPLAVMVADCVPVVLSGATAAGGPILAVAHAGRPGVATGVVGETVHAMRSAGAEEIQAWLGPSVCGNCYEVPEQLRADVSAIEPSAYATTSWGTPALDLPAAVMSQLQAAGVAAQRVHACTMEEPLLFSHRRDAPTGRFAGVIYARR